MKFGRTINVAGMCMFLLVGLAACDRESTERRAKAAAEKIQSSIPNQLAVALKQNASAEDIKAAQEALVLVNEYMGEVNGELDAVTVNAIQAFQRRNGLEDDGILDDETKRLLREVRRRNAS